MPRNLLARSVLVLLVSSAAAQQRDNLLILLADDMGVDNVGVYGEGSNPPPTPNIDALAARGVLFRNAWANALCSPTRAAITTGRYCFRTGVGYAITPLCRQCGFLDTDELTIPEMLDRGRSGYAHGYVGKYHLGDYLDVNAPNDHGWSYFAGFVLGEVDYYNWLRTENGISAMCTTYTTTKFVDDALAWIGKQSGPWVLYLAFNAPHGPFHKPPPSLHTQDLSKVGESIVPLYRAMAEAMDTEIGRLLRGLGPQLANTNIVFMGDNGTPYGAVQPPFLSARAKSTPYEGGCNVPLIVAGPAVNQPGREVAALVHAVDLFSTVADLTGVDTKNIVKPWQPLDSISFAPYLGDPNQAPLRTTVYSEQFVGGSFLVAAVTGFSTVRNSRYKLIRKRGPLQDELYDLWTDPFEQVDLLQQGSLSAAELAAYRQLDGTIASLRHPTAGLYPYGTASCVGSNGTPTIGGSGSPVLSSSYQIQLDSAAPSSPVLLSLGTSFRQLSSGVPLPLDLSAFGGGTGCFLYTSDEAMIPDVTDAAGHASHTFALPYALDLVERTVHHSWVVLDPSAPGNQLGVVTTSAIAARVGLR